MNRYFLLRRGCLVVLLGFFVDHLSAAGLAWLTTSVAVQPIATAATAVAEYRFRNTSDQTVTILSVAPSCSCTTAKADKAAYAPGEAGVIRAELALGGREGRQEKSIAVRTDDAPNDPQRLRLTVDIPELLGIHPKQLFWGVGEPGVEKEIELLAPTPELVVIGDVQCAEPTFTARLETLATKGRYRVKIKPTSTAKIAQATIRLSAMVEGQPRVFVLYVAVR